MSQLRLALRLARREVWRRPGRTALVVLLIALPVAAMVIAVVFLRTDRELTPREAWERSYGQADVVVDGAIELVPTGIDGDARSDPTQAPVVPGPPTTEVAVGVPAMPPPADRIGIPAGTEVTTVTSWSSRVRSADGRRADVEWTDLPVTDPVAEGSHDLVAGRAPAVAGEVALGPDLADQLGVDVGDDLVLDRPPATLRVIGLVERVACLSCGVAVVARGELDGLLLATSETGAPGLLPANTVLPSISLLELPDVLTQPEAEALQRQGGYAVQVRQLITDPSVPEAIDTYSEYGKGRQVRWALVLGALVLVVAGIVISAAFAVGARRQLVSLGQLSASGASPATVRAALVLQGTVTGIAGAAVGLGVAGVALALGRGTVEQVLDERITGYIVRPREVLAAALLGVAAASVAALIPARTAAAIPTLAALGGRRPLAPVSRRLVVNGTFLFVTGLGLLALAVIGSAAGTFSEVWAAVAILGGAFELFGACALAPLLVARLEPLAARVRGATRLGARSLARHRARTAAVVSAVAAAGALAVTASALLLGNEARTAPDRQIPDDVVLLGQEQQLTDPPFYRTGPADEPLVELVREVLPDAPVVTLRGSGMAAIDSPQPWELLNPGIPESPQRVGQVLLADDVLREVLDIDGRLRRALDEDGVAVLHDDASGPVRLTGPTGAVVEARFVPSSVRLPHSDVLVTPAAAATLGFDIVPVRVALLLDHPLTADERDGLEDLRWDLAGLVRSETDPALLVEHRPVRSGLSPFEVELLLAALALVFALFVIGVSLALAAAEAKDERDVLTVAGAPPAVLARAAAVRAWLLATIGGAMAVPIGFLPVLVFTSALPDDRDVPLVFPSRTVLLLALVAPVLIALAAWLTSASAQRLRPVRVSTVVFE